MCTAYCFSTAAMVARTHLNTKVHCLSCFNFCLVQWEYFSLTTNMWLITVCDFTFVSTSETETHRVSGSEGCMKGLLGPDGWEFIGFNCYSFVTHTPTRGMHACARTHTHTHTPTHTQHAHVRSHARTHGCRNIFHLLLLIMQVYYLCGVQHICFWNTSICTSFCSGSMTHCIIWVLRVVSFTEALLFLCCSL